MLKSLPLSAPVSQSCLGSWEHSLHGLASGTTGCFTPAASILCSQKALVVEGEHHDLLVSCYLPLQSGKPHPGSEGS